MVSFKLSRQERSSRKIGETPANTEADSVSPRGGDLDLATLASKMEKVRTWLCPRHEDKWITSDGFL